MPDIPVEELYEAYLKLLQYVRFTRYLLLAVAIYLFALAFYCYEARADKETRKRIKALAKEKKTYQYVIVKDILRSYFIAYDRIKLRQMNEENKAQSFEEWKLENHKEEQSKKPKQIVKPIKKTRSR